MNIILTVNFSPWSSYCGGGQQSTHQLACALSARGHDVSVVYTKPVWERVETPELPYRVRWAAFCGLRSRRDAPARPLNALTVAREISKLRLSQRSIVHSQGEEGAAIPLLRSGAGFVVTPRYPAYPLVMMPHVSTSRGARTSTRSTRILTKSWPASAENRREFGDFSPLPVKGTSAGWFDKLKLYLLDAKYPLLGCALRRARFYCPTSRASAAVVQQVFGLSESNCRVIPNGLNPAFFEVQRQLDACRGPLVFFGRLEHSKGVDTLVEALGRMGRQCPRTILIGQGTYQSTLESRIRALGLSARITLAGWLAPAELASVLATASMAVLPSREESFGNAMAESMAAGVPLITTNAGSIPELVDHDRTGLLLEPGDADMLARAIRELVGQPERAEALGLEARLAARSRYSWDATAQQYESVYMDCDRETV